MFLATKTSLQSCLATFKMYSFSIIKIQHLHLRLREHCWRGGRNILKPEDQGVCCETASPNNVGNYTHEVWPIWLQRHELTKNGTHTKWPFPISPACWVLWGTPLLWAASCYLLQTSIYLPRLHPPPNMEPYRLDSLPAPISPTYWVLWGTVAPWAPWLSPLDPHFSATSRPIFIRLADLKPYSPRITISGLPHQDHQG